MADLVIVGRLCSRMWIATALQSRVWIAIVLLFINVCLCIAEPLYAHGHKTTCTSSESLQTFIDFGARSCIGNIGQQISTQLEQHDVQWIFKASRNISAHFRYAYAIVRASSALEDCGIANDGKFVIDGLSESAIEERAPLLQPAPILDGIVKRPLQLKRRVFRFSSLLRSAPLSALRTRPVQLGTCFAAADCAPPLPQLSTSSNLSD